nr:AAA family ATPase [Chloroflexota bacterium]
PAQPAGAERRLVTVLFADLVGFTPFAEERDAEDVRETLERYSGLASEVVARYGGTVEKFIGDAVMAVWGTPSAHEDDAERAVRAALELVDAVRALGPAILARAGVLTGEAAVNVAATNQGLLAGDLVNTAARLQSVAPPGAVLVGESTMRAASAALAFEPAGEQALKGKQAPVPAWRALRVVANLGGSGRTEMLETPFVGRDEEFRLLREQLHVSGRDPRVRLISVTGPAGIGKSRLAWELEKYVGGLVEVIYWHRGRCPAYGEGVSFWALGEMVRQRAGLAETDNEVTTRGQIEATVAEFVRDETERPWISQALLVLLGVEQQAQSGRETVFAAWRRFFENIAARGTTVLVFEDLHWADSGLLDFIDHLLDWSKQVPLLVVTLARPELFDRRPDWGAGRRTFTALALDPLPNPAMREMLTVLAPDLPESALRAIIARADGIPLYAVETVRMLVADGRLEQIEGRYRATRELGDLEVPDSLRSLIMSRLDALAADDRRLLQEASVLGQSFTLPALAAVNASTDAAELESRLRGLVRRELLALEADPRSPERGQYAFMQSLIREVAYSTLARPERRRRHLAAARYFEATGGDETAAVLASHYVAAHDASPPGAEADAVAAQARVALRAAADRAAALGGHDQAAAYLEQALAMTAERAERAQLLERKAAELDLAGRYDQSLAAAQGAIEEYRALDDANGMARTRVVLAADLIDGARIAEALAELEQARAELTDDVEPAIRAQVLAKLAHAYYRDLQLDRSLEMAEVALTLAEHHRLNRTIAEAMVSRGTALWMSSRQREALVLLRAGMELAKRERDIGTVLRAAANLAPLIATAESSREAVAVGREAVELARTTGNRGSAVWQVGNMAIGACFAGLPLDTAISEVDEMLALDLDESDRDYLMVRKLPAMALAGYDVSDVIERVQASRRLNEDAQRKSGHHFTSWIVALSRGDYATAAQEAALATEAAPNYGTMGLAGVLAALAGDPARARQYMARADELPIVGRDDQALREAGRAVVLGDERGPAAALPHFRESLDMLHETGNVLQFGIVAMAMLRILGPDSPEARAAGEEALANFEKMGAHSLVEQLRAALERPAAEREQARSSAATTAPVRR